MSVQNLQEMWEVEAGGQIYPAMLEELPSWIDEGSLLPDDKVRRGNLRWIEARKVPALVPFFNAKAIGEPMPGLKRTTTSLEPAIPAANQDPGQEGKLPLAEVITGSPLALSDTTSSGFCRIHVENSAIYVCSGCSGEFCKLCPKAFGGSVRICPDCGSMCKLIAHVNETKKFEGFKSAAIKGGFGAADFFQALSHPFKFKTSLVLGAFMFMLFTLGQSASTIGGIYMIVASLFCFMLANMLTFGILSTTIDNFSRGDLDANFMPGFEDFSIWDDVIRPFFLSVAVYVSSFGPFILIFVVGTYFVISSASSQTNAIQDDLKRLPGTQYYTPDRTLEQSDQVKQLLGNVKEQNAKRLAQQDETAAGNSTVVVDQDAAEQERLWKMAQNSRKQQLESIAGKTAETRQRENEQLMAGFLRLAAPIVVLGFIALLWGLFYFPAACAVAGYTNSFLATLNPLVGLDTIRRLGSSYAKILVMGLVILIISAFAGGLLATAFSPFDIPGMGNLPAKAIQSLITFYFSVVFSCVLGFALFKASDRLKLQT